MNHGALQLPLGCEADWKVRPPGNAGIPVRRAGGGWFVVLVGILLVSPAATPAHAVEAISREISVFVAPVESDLPNEAISREVTVYAAPETPGEDVAEAISREVTVFATAESSDFAVTEAISRELSVETSPAMPPVRLPDAFVAGNLLFESVADTRPTNPDRLPTPAVVPLSNAGTRVYAAGSVLFSGPAFEASGDLYPTVQHEQTRDLLLLHPGRGSRGASVGVPVTQPGTFLITGSFARANDARLAGNGVAVAVLRNFDAANPLFAAAIGPDHAVNAEAPFTGSGMVRFSLLAALFPDDVVRFVAFNGDSGQDIDFDVTAVEATVVPVDSVSTAFSGAAPEIRFQPSGQTVPLGSTASFQVVASGDAPLSYQWHHNGVPLLGATNATLTLPVVKLTDGGSYSVAVANEAGSAESEPALLEFQGLPSLALADNFANRQVFTDESLIGMTNNLAATGETAAGEPKHAGKAGGRSLWLTWRASAPGVATFRTTGSSFDTLLAVYTGAELNSLKEVASDEDRGGFLTSELKFNAEAGVDYQVAVDGFAGATGSVVLGWNLDFVAPVLPTIAVNGQPADVLAPVGQPVTFQVTAGPPGVRYQWFANGPALAGATAATLTLPAVSAAQAGSYHVRVTAPSGAFVDSREALLEVTAQEAGHAGSLSAEKLADLFADDPAGAPNSRGPAPAGRLRRTGFTSVSVGVPGAQFLNLTGATSEPGDPVPCDLIVGASRWLRFRTAQPLGLVTLATTNAEFDTVLAVFTNRFAPVTVVCNDDALPGLRNSRVVFAAVPGVDYLVMVAAKGRAAGGCGLTWSAPTGEVTDGPAMLERTGIEDGHFTFSRVVPSGQYLLDRATSLEGFAPFQQIRVRSGLLQFRDPDPTDSSVRFYRIGPIR